MIPLYVLVFVPVVLGALGYFVPRRIFYWSLLVVQTAQTAAAAEVFLRVRSSGPFTEHLGRWPVAIGIALQADILSTVMVLLSAALFLAYLLYNAQDHYTDNMFLFLFMFAQTVIVALFLSNDVFNLYVLLELSMIIVTVLIMYKKGYQSFYDGMLFIMMNSFGMTFMLFGIGFLYRITGVLDFTALPGAIAAVADRRLLAVPYTLIMTSVAMKAALFPLFSWLPRAHGAPSAPSVVSAMLSGIVVKVGVFLLLRFRELFFPVFQADHFFFVIAFLTATAGFLLALCQNDIKLILAYHTISQVGLIVMGLTAGNDYAYWGGVYHIVNHAFFKGLLFLTAGVIIEEYGTRDYTQIRGVFRRMPLIGAASVMGVLGITGAPFFNGSISKYLIQQGLAGDFREAALLLVNLGTIVSFVKYSSILPFHQGGRLSRLVGLWQTIGIKAATREAAGRKSEQLSQNRTVEGVVSLALGGICLAGGIAGAAFISVLFRVDLNVDGAFFLSKTLIFLITFATGILIYRFLIVPAKPLFVRVQSTAFTFNDIALGVTVFCTTLGLYLVMTS